MELGQAEGLENIVINSPLTRTPVLRVQYSFRTGVQGQARQPRGSRIIVEAMRSFGEDVELRSKKG